MKRKRVEWIVAHATKHQHQIKKIYHQIIKSLDLLRIHHHFNWHVKRLKLIWKLINVKICGHLLNKAQERNIIMSRTIYHCLQVHLKLHKSMALQKGSIPKVRK